jgi:uncharacterized membrane protein YgcG
MSIADVPGDFSKRWLRRRGLAFLVSSAVLFTAGSQHLAADQGAPMSAPATTSQPDYAQQAPEQLQQLVAPIALYPDSLVAQILAASTFPEQLVEADRWVQAHADLQGNALAQAVDQQPWDPSVKALAAFPSVLGNMDKNLSWASSLGDAYYNQQQDVMDAVQAMRQRAQEAGNLNSNPQQNVATQDDSIVIQPASPDIVYVPAYDPWLIYGAPMVAWPGWYPYPGIWGDGPYLSFGIGFGVGFFGGFGWGWGNWGFDWHNRYPMYNHERYFSRSSTFYNRSNYYRAGGARGVQSNVARGMSANRPGGVERSTTEPFAGRSEAARGYAEPGGESGVRSGAFSGYDHGGQTRGFSSRGSSSFGGGQGGGASHAGGRPR